MSHPVNNEQQTVLETRVTFLERAVDEIRDAVKSIDGSLQVLARLETSHSETRNAIGRAFSEIEDHEKRLRAIEEDMPTMRLARGWVIGGMAAIVGLLCIAIFKLVVH